MRHKSGRRSQSQIQSSKYRQLDEIGSRSFPLVALAGAAIGAVLALETRASLVQFGAKSMLPAAMVFSIIHETGPVVTGLVVCGRVGAGISSAIPVAADFSPTLPSKVPPCAQTTKPTNASTTAKSQPKQSCSATKSPSPKRAATSFTRCKPALPATNPSKSPQGSHSRREAPQL